MAGGRLTDDDESTVVSDNLRCDEQGQTTLEYAFVILIGMALCVAAATAFGFVPDFVRDALDAVL